MRKEFVDKNKVDKERRLEQSIPVVFHLEYPETSKKGLKKSKKEVKASLDAHRLGWTTNSGEEL